MRSLSGIGRTLLGALLVGPAVVAAALGEGGSGAAGTRPSSIAAKPPVPASVDLHPYPRTFHLYGSSPLEELARYDMFVGTSSVKIGTLRALNPRGIFLLQPGISGSKGNATVHITAPGGAVGWPGATDLTKSGKKLGTIRPVNPEWDLLHNADGSIAAMGKVLGWNLAAPPDKGVPAEVAKIFAYAAKRDGLYCTVRIGRGPKRKRVPCWNGVHSDNWIYSAIGASWFYGSRLDTNRDGVVDDEATLRRNWSNGLTGAGTLLRAYLPGMIVGGNGAWYRPDLYAGADPTGWLKASNYTMIEDMEKFSPATLLSTAKRWHGFRDPLGQPRYLAALAYATDSSGKLLLWTEGDPNTAAAMQRPDVVRSLRWGLTLSMMTGVYYELVGDWYGNPIQCRWWFDEYDGGVGVRRRGYLGQPLGPYKEVRRAVYRRDFQNGIAINNSSSTTQTIALGGSYRKLRGTQDPAVNDGSTVSSVVVPAGDGIILLRI
jgi:hypothetical protein